MQNAAQQIVTDHSATSTKLEMTRGHRLRATVCKNQTEPGSDFLRIGWFLDILFLSMMWAICENFSV